MIYAVDFYVDASTGNDLNTGTSEIEAWRTISRVNSQSLLAGDRVLFRCGESWSETLSVMGSNDPTMPVTYTQYGNNCDHNTKPIINGAETIQSTWQQDPLNQNIYYVDGINYAITQVFVNGSRVGVAREPNLGTLNPTYRIISVDSVDIIPPDDPRGITARHYLVDNQLSTDLNMDSQNDLVGAEVHIRNQRWRLQDRIVSGFDPVTNLVRWDDIASTDIQQFSTEIKQGKLSSSCTYFDQSGRCSYVEKDFGYYFANKYWMMDIPYEWHHDRQNGRLYILLPNNTDPNSLFIQASKLDYGISASNQSNITIDGLKIERTRYDAVYMKNSININILNVDLNYAGGSGILFNNYLVSGVGDVIISSSNINYPNVSGIRLLKVLNSQVINNTITSPGNLLYANPDVADSFNGGRAIGINVQGGPGSVIFENTITGAGYSGISVTGSSYYTRISKNIVTRCCWMLDDGGGIYLGGRENEVEEGLEVTNNIVSYSEGNTDGVSGNGSAAEGIYLDSDVDGATISNNVIYGVSSRGLFVHIAYDNILFGNIMYDNKDELSFYENKNGGFVDVVGNIYGNIIEENTVLHKSNNAAINLVSLFDDFDFDFTFGNFYRNNYASLYSDNIVYEKYRNSITNLSVENKHTFSDWKTIRNQDLNSYGFNEFIIQNEAVLNYISDNAVSNPDFTSDVVSWGCWFPGKQIGELCESPNPSIRQWKEQCGLDSGCLYAKAPKISYMVVNSKNDINLAEGRYYLVEFVARSNIVTVPIKITVREGGNGYLAVGLSEFFDTIEKRKYYSYLFQATQTLSNARVDFRIPEGGELYVDNIRLREVNTIQNDQNDDSILLVNATNFEGNFSALPADNLFMTIVGMQVQNAQYVTVDNIPVIWPVSVSPYSAIPLIRADDPFRDSDFDGRIDTKDNCINVANDEQFDSNVDGYGNICDPDFDGNLIISNSDYNVLRANFGLSGKLEQDLNGDGIVTGIDYSILRLYWDGIPGPSGITQ